MELDHEKFAGVKELAEISTKISAGTAALAALKDSEETYLSEREQKLVGRLKATLVDSGELIKAIGENHSALVGYSTLVGDFLNTVLSLIQSVNECTAMITSASDELEARMNEHDETVRLFKESSQRERVLIEGQQGELAQGWDALHEGERKLADGRATLERALNRLKK